jgi:hypothetical protein
LTNGATSIKIQGNIDISGGFLWRNANYTEKKKKKRRRKASKKSAKKKRKSQRGEALPVRKRFCFKPGFRFAETGFCFILANILMRSAGKYDIFAGHISKPTVCLLIRPAKMWVEWSVGGAADLAKPNPEPL